ncbi:MAG: hypothetical protein ACOYJ1_01460 [Peptococcales bacterium]
MWLLAYWWQGLFLILLYGFLFLVFKEITNEHLKEPVALFQVINGPRDSQIIEWPENQMLFLYRNEQIKINGEKLYASGENILLEHDGEIQKLIAGDIFEFAGGSLKLVRWDNARQFINQYRTSAKSQ